MTTPTPPAPTREAYQIPLDRLPEWLAEHGLRVVGGDPDADFQRHGGQWRPVLFLLPAADPAPAPAPTEEDHSE